jgi:hypothetical protein
MSVEVYQRPAIISTMDALKAAALAGVNAAKQSLQQQMPAASLDHHVTGLQSMVEDHLKAQAATLVQQALPQAGQLMSLMNGIGGGDPNSKEGDSNSNSNSNSSAWTTTQIVLLCICFILFLMICAAIYMRKKDCPVCGRKYDDCLCDE